MTELKDYKLYIFDWDGTLMDTTQAIANGIQYACQKLGFEVVSHEKALSIIGVSAVIAIPLIIPEIKANPALMGKFDMAYFEYIDQHSSQDFFFPEVLSFLSFLQDKNKLLAVATGKSRDGLDVVLLDNNLNKYFVVTKTATECHSKPNPQMLSEILDFTGVNASDAVMIGDTSYDINMANNIGMDSVALTQGAHQKLELICSNPTYIYSKISDFYLDVVGAISSE